MCAALAVIPSGNRTTVLVNGTVVVENAKHTGATLGWCCAAPPTAWSGDDNRSNPGPPFISLVFPITAVPVADPGEILYHLNAHDVFGHLIAELALVS